MRTTEFSLSPRWRPVAFLSSIVLASALLAGEALRTGLALTLAHPFSLNRLRQAARIDPGNPEVHRRLGLYYLNSAENLDPREAVAQLRLAAQLNSFDPVAWSDLAEACEVSRDDRCADQALHRALTLSPMTPRLYWQAAVHYVVTGRPESALPDVRLLLQLDPQYSTAAFRLFPECLENSRFVLNDMLPQPASTAMKLDYLNFLTAYDKDDLAYNIWNDTLANSSQVTLAAIAPFLENLLSQGRAQQGAAVWKALESSGAVQKPSDPANLVFNGNFEHALLNVGFGWRIQASPEVFINPDSCGGGGHCLEIDFTVPANDELEPVYQLIAVEPQRAYTLTALVRSDSITSRSGPCLRVMDAACPACLDRASTQATDTMPWHTASLTFSTGPATHLIRLSVWRPRSRSFPFEITGTYWLSGVSVKPVDVAAGLSRQ